jgi:hypothetical protein
VDLLFTVGNHFFLYRKVVGARIGSSKNQQLPKQQLRARVKTGSIQP